MNNLKDKFLHNSFFNYMRLLRNGSNVTQLQKSGSTELLVTLFAVIILVLVEGSLTFADNSYFIGFGFLFGDGILLYVCSLSIGRLRNSKPSAMTVAPIGYKKRILYAYISSFVCSLAIIIYFILFILAVILFIVCMNTAVTGEWAVIVETSATENELSAEGILFRFFTCILLFGAGMSISSVKSKKIRYILLFAFPALLEVVALIFINFSTPDPSFLISANVAENFKNLPISWLWLTIYAIVAAAVFAFSVFLVIKNEKPKEF